MLPEEFLQKFNVSRETFEKFEVYHTLLMKWQKAINLVGSKTLENAWERHFSDSAQLVNYMPEGVQIVADLGSGAGFPGLALAILKPELQINLIESDERKTQFLRTVSRETDTPVEIHNERIENLADVINPDLVTARALAPLETICAYCLDWAVRNPDLIILVLKGRAVAEEIQRARKSYDFKLEEFESKTEKGAKILRITSLIGCA